MQTMNKAGMAASVPGESDVAARVDALLAHMTLAEKIGQLNQVGGAYFTPSPKAEDQIRAGGAGSVLWLNNTRHINELQKIAVEESTAGIPLLFALDVIHGYRTIFPAPLAMAASWEPAVPEHAQTVAEIEELVCPILAIKMKNYWRRLSCDRALVRIAIDGAVQERWRSAPAQAQSQENRSHRGATSRWGQELPVHSGNGSNVTCSAAKGSDPSPECRRALRA